MAYQFHKICQTCKQRKPSARLRLPVLEDRVEAKKMAYISCDACFGAVWAGEE